MQKTGFNVNPGGRLTKTTLASLLGFVFIAITLLTGSLVYYAHSQLKWLAFHQYRGLATSITQSLEARLTSAIAAEQQRPVAQYRFYDLSVGRWHRSDLSQLLYRGEFTDSKGYFQVDGNGQFSSPLLPQPENPAGNNSLSPTELLERRSIANDLASILGNSSIVESLAVNLEQDDTATTSSRAQAKRMPGPTPQSAPVATPVSPATSTAASTPESGSLAATDSTLSELKLDLLLSKKSENYERRQRQPDEEESEAPDQSELSYEVGALQNSATEEAELSRSPADASVDDSAIEDAQSDDSGDEVFPRVTTFNSAPAPFEFSVLDSGHFVLFRRVQTKNETLVQGMVLPRESFLEAEIGQPFVTSVLVQHGQLVVALDETVVARYPEPMQGSQANTTDVAGNLLYEHQLASPFGRLRLVYSLAQMPAGPTGGVLLWVSVALATVLCGGFYILYRAGLKQIELSQQQENFVASVTHELKTPLTSIRMYGEMLQSGWVSDEKRHEYYRYIHDESQRLSRLIGSVLQLANISNESLLPELSSITAVELMAGIKATLETHLQNSETAVDYTLEAAVASRQVRLDRDAWAQVVINLVDNAIKFSQAGKKCRLSIEIAQRGNKALSVDFRDYGPGIPDDQRKKIFQLFYRSENELVRQTAGTGIGLAIVAQLLDQMNAQIGVSNAHPGALFRVTIPLA